GRSLCRGTRRHIVRDLGWETGARDRRHGSGGEVVSGQPRTTSSLHPGFGAAGGTAGRGSSDSPHPHRSQDGTNRAPAGGESPVEVSSPDDGASALQLAGPRTLLQPADRTGVPWILRRGSDKNDAVLTRTPEAVAAVCQCPHRMSLRYHPATGIFS